MAAREVLFVRELQDDGKQYQQLMHDVVMDVASKVLYLCSVGVDNLGLSPLECWDELRDVEDLCVIEDAGFDLLQVGVSNAINPSSLAHMYTEVVFLLSSREACSHCSLHFPGQPGTKASLRWGGRKRPCQWQTACRPLLGPDQN